jgi:3-deoxy-D-arabino-heptulosonate 7-phosphate (DAHP) synthase class II
MEKKSTAIYLRVLQEELTEADRGSYEAPLARQRQRCLGFLREKLGVTPDEPVEVYTSRSQLLMDIDRQLIRRVVVEDLFRLGASREEIEGLKFELGASGIELVSINDA